MTISQESNVLIDSLIELNINSNESPQTPDIESTISGIRDSFILAHRRIEHGDQDTSDDSSDSDDATILTLVSMLRDEGMLGSSNSTTDNESLDDASGTDDIDIMYGIRDSLVLTTRRIAGNHETIQETSSQTSGKHNGIPSQALIPLLHGTSRRCGGNAPQA